MADFNPIEVLNKLYPLFNVVNIVACCSRDLIVSYGKWAEANKCTYDIHVWFKPNAIPFCSGTFKSDVEYIALIYSSGRQFNSGKHQSVYSKVFTHNLIPENGEKLHPTRKPDALMLKYMDILSPAGGLILDPFLGSGTTAVCAKKLGRKCIGIEIEEKYCEIAVKRLAQSVMRLEV
jgi:site-specific DNA-methyltransferase (adenine-specific)